MVDTLKELLHSSLSEQSRKQYSRAWVVFTEFYTRYQSADLHFPVSTACIALFISFLCAKGLAPATINSYLSAIAYVHKIKGHYDPTKSFLVEKLLVALGRRGQADVRMPISRPLLYELVSALQHSCPSAYRRSLFGAMFMTAFYGFFRIGELSCKSKKQVDTVLQFDQVTFLKQSSRVTAVKIVITKFKHNTNHRPFVITIESEPSEPFCPVQTLIDYIKLRGYHKAPCSRVQLAGQSQHILLTLSSVVLRTFVALIALATRAIAFALVQRAMRLRKVFRIRKSVP